MTLYSKPWRSYEDQLDELHRRGLIVTDRPKALECLERIGYYRLSGYLSRPGRFFGRFLNKSGDLARQDLRASRGV